MIASRSFGTFLREERIGFRLDEPLAQYTTLKVGGPVEYLIEPKDEFELADVMQAARECDVPVRLMGAGANLLVGDEGVPGAAIRLTHLTRRSGFHVQAGYPLPQLVKETVSEGYGGLECLAGIPATVGGAVKMNAGGRHGEIADAVRYVDVLTPEGDIRQLSPAEVGFSYRNTNLGPNIVVAVGFNLSENRNAGIRYETVMSAKKRSQPLGSPNAGCMFKNPPGGSAGLIIQQHGLKGERVGRAHVSTKHANFIINEGGARAGDVFRLIDVIRNRVPLELELEVLTW